jgi:hypothetical protein
MGYFRAEDSEGQVCSALTTAELGEKTAHAGYRAHAVERLQDKRPGRAPHRVHHRRAARWPGHGHPVARRVGETRHALLDSAAQSTGTRRVLSPSDQPMERDGKTEYPIRAAHGSRSRSAARRNLLTARVTGRRRRAEPGNRILAPAGQRLGGRYKNGLVMTDALSSAWADIRAKNPGVPEVVIALAPGLDGSTCGSVMWSGSPVLLAAIPQRAKARDVLGWLLHQAAHGLDGNPSTASKGRYHGAGYRDAASALGLKVTKDDAFGWSRTGLADSLAREYGPTIKNLGIALQKWEPPLAPARATKNTNGIAVFCQCSPRRRIRVTESVFDLGPIRCDLCGQPFTAA